MGLGHVDENWRHKERQRMYHFPFITLISQIYIISAMGLGHVDENWRDKEGQRVYHSRYITNVSLRIQRTQYESILPGGVLPKTFCVKTG